VRSYFLTIGSFQFFHLYCWYHYLQINSIIGKRFFVAGAGSAKKWWFCLFLQFCDKLSSWGQMDFDSFGSHLDYSNTWKVCLDFDTN